MLLIHVLKQEFSEREKLLKIYKGGSMAEETKEKQQKKLLQWHAAFFADIQIELAEEAKYLEFENEHTLGTKPMQLDVLIIKKDSNRKIRKNIGRIFRGHNIVEYKSPTDTLSVDDFFKVYGYACFYKADTRKTDEIKSNDLTLTFVCHSYPRKLCTFLKEVLHRTVTKEEAGLYYISDPVFPIQLLVQKQLSKDENLWLASLTNELCNKEEIDHLLEDYQEHENENLYRSVMNMIVTANRKRFEVDTMCEALDEIIEFHVQKRTEERLKEREKSLEAKVEARIEARIEAKVQEGRLEERLEMLRSLVRDGLLSLAEAAKRAEMTEEKMQELLGNG